MEYYYSSEKSVQMLVYLLKAHKIRKVIVSPGTTNITFVASIQQDPYFEVYSSVDERSAAYMACGLAAESGEPVVISCTGATASRNYVPALTEAFYRKLPVLAVTSTQHTGKIGQLVPQVIDRSNIQNDIAVMSVDIPIIYDWEDEWSCNVKLNSALLALRHKGGGPVHINLTTTHSKDFSVKTLPEFRVIQRITLEDEMPRISSSRVGIFVGSHLKWSEALTNAVEKFCELYNGVVLCDHTSNYRGKYRIQYSLLSNQSNHHYESEHVELLIDMGEVSGAYFFMRPKEVWRVNPDGVVRDKFKTALTKLFEMSELQFFTRLNDITGEPRPTDFYRELREEYDRIISCVPELPFSNTWIAKTTTPKLPKHSVLHLGILNSLRCWNLFEMSETISCYANTGGFGIDGTVSALIGASLADTTKLHFIVVGDLAFFYDMNSVGNRHVGRNIRILLVNNGLGTEFRNYNNYLAAQVGEDVNKFIAAEGHYGRKSSVLVKHYAEDLGFTYLSANNKEEFINSLAQFVDPHLSEKPILFEVFTDAEDESEALRILNELVGNS